MKKKMNLIKKGGKLFQNCKFLSKFPRKHRKIHSKNAHDQNVTTLHFPKKPRQTPPSTDGIRLATRLLVSRTKFFSKVKFKI